MRPNRIRQLWQEGKPAIGGWCGIPSSFATEIMAHQGFDWLCVDLQHGIVDYQVAVTMLQAISTTETMPIVRVPWNDPAWIMKVLDAGAYGVIIPLVNTKAEAEAAVAACRYPPVGIRSSGPARAIYYGGRDYQEHANEEILCICMIETKQGIANLDEICSVPGLDAVYIGPADLSLALGLPPRADVEEQIHVDTVRRIRETAHNRGIKAAMHCAGAPFAARKAVEGFDMVMLTSDSACLVRSASEQLATMHKAIQDAQVGAQSGTA
ncbi:MAG: HpcH/HpaI aldolase family protein [Dehalococcoidia bacterium]